MCGTSAAAIAMPCAAGMLRKRVLRHDEPDEHQQRRNRGGRDQVLQDGENADQARHQQEGGGHGGIRTAGAHALVGGMADINRRRERRAEHGCQARAQAVPQHRRGDAVVIAARPSRLDIAEGFDEIVNLDRDYHGQDLGPAKQQVQANPQVAEHGDRGVKRDGLQMQARLVREESQDHA